MAENTKGGILNKTEKFLRRRKTKVTVAMFDETNRFYFTVFVARISMDGCLAVAKKFLVNKLAGV